MTITNSHFSNIDEYAVIERVIQHYIDGARTGKGDDMRPAFHPEATIFGYVGEDLFSGPIENLYQWNDANGPAKDIVAKIVSIDIVGTAASVRVESDNWTGHRFTDFFNILKINGQWKIMSKIFHLHA
ncbi:MAG: lumazine-binding protein [Methylotenera sp.]|nr:MAG: lumazine-binding protein [Methylotenera sp.]